MITTKLWELSQRRRWARCHGTPLAVGLALLANPLAASAASGGSGFFLGGDKLATAAHVVTDCARVTVRPEDGQELPARLVSRDYARDVAVLEVPGADFPAPDLGGVAEPGEGLTALGYLHVARGGERYDLPLTAITLPIPRPADRMPLHGPVAEPGMSGSPLVDAGGRVAGMLLGRGDPAAPAAADLARRIDYPIEEIAIALPARWLPSQVTASAMGPVMIARVLCSTD